MQFANMRRYTKIICVVPNTAPKTTHWPGRSSVFSAAVLVLSSFADEDVSDAGADAAVLAAPALCLPMCNNLTKKSQRIALPSVTAPFNASKKKKTSSRGLLVYAGLQR